MLRALIRSLGENHHANTKLHRWCLPVGPYAHTCNQALKADMANSDNSLFVATRPQPTPADYSDCPVARVVVNGFGV